MTDRLDLSRRRAPLEAPTVERMLRVDVWGDGSRVNCNMNDSGDPDMALCNATSESLVFESEDVESMINPPGQHE